MKYAQKLTIKTSGVFTVNFEHISNLVVEFLALKLCHVPISSFSVFYNQQDDWFKTISTFSYKITLKVLFIVNFEHISNLVVEFLSLKLCHVLISSFSVFYNQQDDWFKTISTFSYKITPKVL